MGAERDKDLTDIALCYQALGTTISATPAQLEQHYKSLTEEYKKKLLSQDTAIREAARANLEQVSVMYEKIKGSITYRAMEKDFLKNRGNAAEAAPKRPEMRVTVHCSCCNGLIPKGLRTCPICKSPLYSAMEQRMRAILAPKKLALYFLIVSAVSLAVLGVRNPGKFSTQAVGALLQINK